MRKVATDSPNPEKEGGVIAAKFMDGEPDEWKKPPVDERPPVKPKRKSA